MPAIASSFRALWPLVALFRTAMCRQIGVRAAQAMGVLALVGFAFATLLLTDRYGPDATPLLMARSALAVVASCGTLAGLSLARSPKDASAGIVALAESRGFSPAAIDRAAMLASLRLAAETVLGPILVIGAFALAIAASRHLSGTWRAALGTAAFGAVASVGVGLLASACRTWGGARGRSWFVIAIVGPWLLTELMPAVWGSEYLSIPGLVGRAYALLAMGDL
jgi:hypothetical protein